MVPKKHFILVLFIFLALLVGCSVVGAGGMVTPQSAGLTPVSPKTMIPSAIAVDRTAASLPGINSPLSTQGFKTPTQTASPTSTITPAPTETEVVYEVGREITIKYLRELEIAGSEISFEGELAPGSNYHQHLVSYISEGNKIYGLLTIPFVEPPEGGFKAIVFNHGYIPPTAYRTTERYTAYVDYLARSGFVVFKIDYRGHGNSQGQPSGSYFSPGYTIDSITALKSLQMMDSIDPQGIGMWGHSMAGNFLNSPLQLHHAQDDPVVNIGYSFDLAAVLQENGKEYEFYTYEGGGHNLVSPYFEQAMRRTVEFFRKNL